MTTAIANFKNHLSRMFPSTITKACVTETKSTGVDFFPIIIPLHNALLTGLRALGFENIAMTQSLHR